jgi:hypothetical protein
MNLPLPRHHRRQQLMKRARLVGIFSRSDRTVHRIDELYSAAKAGRNSGSSVEF